MEQATSSGPAPRPAPDVVSRRLGDVVVLVHLPTNRIHELNETGARIWELLSDGLDPAGVADRLAGEFDVEAGEARRAVDELIAQLQAEGLIQ